MTVVDGFLLLVLVLATAAGYQTGLLVRAAGLGGLLVGLIASLVVVPVVVDLVDPTTRSMGLAVTGLGTIACVLVAMIALQSVAFRLRHSIVDERVRALDQFGGAVAGIAATLVFIWFTAPLIALVPGTAARQVRGSTVVRAVTALSPTASNPLAALQSFLADTRFPEVFSGLASALADEPPPPDVALADATVTRVAASAVKIEVTGCGSLFVGSGWVVEPDLIVTNAHVVAGARVVLVRRPDGSRATGEVVVFDGDRDLALVRVPDLGLEPLPRGGADAGEEAASFGHPLGQERLRVAPVRVDRTVSATGRDIYGRGQTEREVVVLAAELAQGDSGSAVVDIDGTVVGTVFAISPADPGTAYALDDGELAAVLEAPRQPGDAGRCS